MNQKYQKKLLNKEQETKKKVKKRIRQTILLLSTELNKHKDDILFDYVFVLGFLNIVDRELKKCEEDIINIVLTSNYDNFELCLGSIKTNIVDLGIANEVKPISLNYYDFKSTKVEKLIRKNFNKFSRDISSSTLNALNTGKIDDLNRYLNDYFKKENKSNSLLNKIMRVSRTENTQTRSAVKLNALEQYQAQGFKLKKRWIHTLSVSYNVISDNYVPRQDHLALDGTVCDKEGYFHTDNGKTLAPGMFGIPEEDINCRCDIDFTL